MSWEKVISMLQRGCPDGTNVQTLELSGKESDEVLLQFLEDLFNSDDSLSTVRLVIHGEVYGFMDRKKLPSLTGQPIWRPGGSGVHFKPAKFQCTVDGCSETKYAPANMAPACDRHPDKTMEKV